MKTRYTALTDGEPQPIVVDSDDGATFTVAINGRTLTLEVDVLAPGEYLIREGKRVVELLVKSGGGSSLDIHCRGGALKVELLDERQLARRAMAGSGGSAGGEGVVEAPMPGRVVKRMIEVGEQVVAGQGVMVVEAMKMENELASPISGRVKEICASEGDAVEAGARLVLIVAEATS